jgi:hypothetical protein
MIKLRFLSTQGCLFFAAGIGVHNRLFVSRMIYFVFPLDYSLKKGRLFEALQELEGLRRQRISINRFALLQPGGNKIKKKRVALRANSKEKKSHPKNCLCFLFLNLPKQTE